MSHYLSNIINPGSPLFTSIYNVYEFIKNKKEHLKINTYKK